MLVALGFLRVTVNDLEGVKVFVHNETSDNQHAAKKETMDYQVGVKVVLHHSSSLKVDDVSNVIHERQTGQER